MNTGVFDGIVREMGTVSTRRRFFHLLGGATAAGAGLAVVAHEESLGKKRKKGKHHHHGGEYPHPDPGGCTGTGQGSCPTGQSCVSGQCRTTSNPVGCTGTGQGTCSTGQSCVNGRCQQDADPEPVVCSTFILSGGPNVTDMITFDDDGSILNLTTGTFLLNDNNGQASSHSPIVNPGTAGDQLRLRVIDWGGCRSVSPLWLHCLETGESTKVFSGDSGNNRCDNPPNSNPYLDITFPIEL
jgi:hypothetical protein